MVLELTSHCLALTEDPLQPFLSLALSLPCVASDYVSSMIMYLYHVLLNQIPASLPPTERRRRIKSSCPLIQGHLYYFSRKLTTGLPFCPGEISPPSPLEILWTPSLCKVNKWLTVHFPNSSSFSYKWNHK